MSRPLTDKEKEVLAHRFLYYVNCTPIISDFEYDKLENAAKVGLPEDSPLHKPGSDLQGSYSHEIIDLADQMLQRWKHRGRK